MRNLLLLVCIVAVVGTTGAEPVEWPVDQGGNGHFYEVVGGAGSVIDGLTWEAANAQANAMSFQGLSGHLAVLTSDSERLFVQSLPEMLCDIFVGPPCLDWHVGGWTIISSVIDPQPYNPPYVVTVADQWVTGENGTLGAPPISSVTGPVGGVLYFKLGNFSLDGFGYPEYGTHAVNSPSTAVGFVVEYDEFNAYNFPGGSVSTINVNWGGIKALYR